MRLFTLGFPGPDYDYDLVRSWLRWRDAKNGDVRSACRARSRSARRLRAHAFPSSSTTKNGCRHPAPSAYTDITAHVSTDGRIARIAFHRPEVRNAFRPHTVDELYRALDIARQDPRIGVVLLTGNGPSPKDGGWAFCSGGDQRIRGRDGYQYADARPRSDARRARRGPRPAALGRLHILEVQRLIRFMPKVVIAVIPGWAAGGGHSLHVVCDLSIASAEHGRFKQTDADVGSFDAGYGSAYFARQIGQKFAREVFFLAEEYSAAARVRDGRRQPRRARTPSSSARRSRWRGPS